MKFTARRCCEEALWDSVLIMAPTLPRSGEASSAAVGPRLASCHTTAVVSVVLFFLPPSGGSSRFPRCCQSIAPPRPRPENSKWRLKTTIRQLCQHGHPSPGKHFYSNRRGASANTKHTTNTHNAISGYTALSDTCHTCTQ